VVLNGTEIGKYRTKMNIIRKSRRIFSYRTKLIKSKMRNNNKKYLLSKDLTESLYMTWEIKLRFSVSSDSEYGHKCEQVNKNV